MSQTAWMTVACLPDAHALDLLGPPPDGVEVVLWDGSGRHPDRLDETTFWVPQVEDSVDLDTKFAAMPALQVVQLTSAGVEDVIGHVPDGVRLCDARGVHGRSVAELVLTLILASQRRLPHFLDAQREGRWDLVEADDLVGKRVLIVGAGDLGSRPPRACAASRPHPSWWPTPPATGCTRPRSCPTFCPAPTSSC